MAGAGLRLGCDRDAQFVTGTCDKIGIYIDFFLVGPFLHELAHHVVRAGHPMIPEPDAELAGGMSAAHERGGDRRRGRRPSSEYTASGQALLKHVNSYKMARCSCRQTPGAAPPAHGAAKIG